MQQGPYWMTVGSYITFSFVLVFAIMACVANFCMVYKNNIKCRWIGYIGLGGLFITGVLGFALTVTTAMAVPHGLFFCDFVEGSAANSENFQGIL